jgi:predicted ATP-grasp superfamily ATP-dependent carboligase
MAERPAVLITGGDHQGLAALRCLARHGIRVYLCDHEHSIGRYSRFCAGFFRAPPPEPVEPYVEFLCTLADREGLRGAVLLPDNDQQVCAMSVGHARLSQCFRTSVPSWEIVQHAYIKARTYELARQVGVPAPHTWVVADEDELRRLDVSFPVILKPSIRDHYYPKTHVKALRAETPAQLAERYREMARWLPPEEILIQEMIPGGPTHLYSAGVLFARGRIVAGIVGRRPRQHPMDFGHATTFAELVELPELLEYAQTLLAAMNFYGIAEVEFMADTRDGKFKLIEINPRIWGWHKLAIVNGVELPYYLYLDLVGEPLPPLVRPPKPVQWVRMITDVPVVVTEILRGRMSVKDWWRSLRGPLAFSVWDPADPLPCLMEFVLLPYLYWIRGF